LAVMEYDFTVDGSDAVAPRRWVEAGLARVREAAGDHLPRVFIGVPLYGRVSRAIAGQNDVLWADLQRDQLRGVPLRLVGRRFVREKLSQVTKVELGPDRVPALIHHDDHRTLAERLRLIDQAGFAHVALWRLGGEDPAIWRVLRAPRRGRR